MTLPTARDFTTVVGGMLQMVQGLAPEITDYTEGGVARSLIEAVAIEQQQLDYQLYEAIVEAILTGTYKNFSFARLSATPASGSVTVTRTVTTGTLIIPAGTLFSVPGSDRTYVSTGEVSLGVGVASRAVPVRAEGVGRRTNTPANTIVVSGISDIMVTNTLPFLNGVDEETDSERIERFRLFILSLSRGTRDAILAAARGVELLAEDGTVTERVTAALVREPGQDPDGRLGLVEVYVDNGSGTSSSALLAEVKRVLQGYRETNGTSVMGWVAAGIEVRTFGVLSTPLVVTVSAKLTLGVDVPLTLTAVQAAITDYLVSLSVFAPAIVAEIIAAAMSVTGVVDCVVNAPTANVDVGQSQRIVPGLVTVVAL